MREILWQDSKHYFTGKPCCHGHISRRTAKSGNCVQCLEEIHYRKKRTGGKVGAPKKSDAEKAATKLAYKIRNREKMLAYNRAYRQKNRDRINASIKAWRNRNIDRVKTYYEKYKQSHDPALRSLQCRLRYRKNPEAHRRRQEKWNRKQRILAQAMKALHPAELPGNQKQQMRIFAKAGKRMLQGQSLSFDELTGRM